MISRFNIPILLITYKRPKYLNKVLTRIKKIKPKILYIYSDGPKNLSEDKDVQKCRKLINDINWCRVKKKFNKSNMGIEQVPKLAINWVFSSVTKAIILEDDTLPELSFFEFCRVLLKKYKNKKKISMISGSNLAHEYSDKIKESYYYSKYSNIWGWATWSDRWNSYDKKMHNWPLFKKEKLKKICYFKREYLWWKKMFNLTYLQKSKNWDYQWTFQNFYKNRWSIVPKNNLISNFGVSNASGKNAASLFNLKLEKIKFPINHPSKIILNKNLDKKICSKTYVLPKITHRIKNKLKKLMNISF